MGTSVNHPPPRLQYQSLKVIKTLTLSPPYPPVPHQGYWRADCIPVLQVMKLRHLHKLIQLVHGGAGLQTKAVYGSRAVLLSMSLWLLR